MAITNIPAINAPSFGGFVYGLDFSRSYSTEASKLTYKVVSKSGSFTTPTIGSDASLSFDTFSFNGRIFSYEKNESNSGNILSVTLIDKSTILDKLYVVVFRPGLFGKNGTSSNVALDVKFTDDEKYYWELEMVQGVYKPVKKALTDSTVSRKIRSGNIRVGDLLIVGREEPPETKCEVASTSYLFNDLKNLASFVSGLSSCPISDDKIKKTYEGTLRSVLNSWCQDFGYSFYWDYSNNSLVFFDLKNSVFNIPEEVSDSRITSKAFSESADGKFNQISANYHIKPYNPKSESLSNSKTSKISYSLVPINYSYFIDRELTSGQTSVYGGGRSVKEFIESAVCGYLSPALREIYNFSYKKIWGANCGITGNSFKIMDAAKVAAALTSSSYAEEIYNMAAFCGKEISGLGVYYDCILVNHDVGIIESWRNVELDIFTSKIGSYYRGVPVISSEYKFCSKNSIFSSSISVEPEAEIYEDSDRKEDSRLSGIRVFNRGGAGPNIAAIEALKTLGIDDGADYIQALLPTKHALSDLNSVGNVLLAYDLLSATDLQTYNTVMFIPKKKLIDDYLKFSVSYTQGANDREQTWREISNSRQRDPSECTLEDLSEKACMSAKQEVTDLQRKNTSNNDEQTEVFTGLDNKNAIGAFVGAFGARVKVLSSSNSTYVACVTLSSSMELLVDTTQQESMLFESNGDTQRQDNELMETRFILENRTTSDNLAITPTLNELASRVGYVQNNNIKKVSYSCAGFVSALSLDAKSGLEGLDMSISDSGFSATYSYSTRPAIFGKQDLSRVNAGSNPSNVAIQLR